MNPSRESVKVFVFIKLSHSFVASYFFNKNPWQCPFTCSITGWGRISRGGPAADILQQGQVPIMSHQDCASKYTRYDSDAHLCAGKGTSSGSGACNGDSGGPLVCEMGGTWYLHGAVSFGKRNCPTTYYSALHELHVTFPGSRTR